MPQEKKFYAIAHNIRSLYNVGAIFRTADALGVTKIFLTGYTGTPKNFKLAKTALGAEKAVPWEYYKRLADLIKRLRAKGVRLAALENNVPGTIDLKKFRPRFPLALIVGEETRGIERDHLGKCGAVVEIPMRGTKESLNVSVAFGIAAYQIARFKK